HGLCRRLDRLSGAEAGGGASALRQGPRQVAFLARAEAEEGRARPYIYRETSAGGTACDHRAAGGGDREAHRLPFGPGPLPEGARPVPPRLGRACRAAGGAERGRGGMADAGREGHRMRGPLTGLRIVEIAGLGPTPFAAMLLADMG